MKAHWIVENFVKEPSFKGLRESIEKFQYPFTPIEGDYRKEMLGELTGKCVIVNGSIKMVKLLKQDLPPDCYPVSYCTFENYKCSAYYSHFGPYLFNDKYCIMSLKEVVRQKYDVWGHYGKDATVFIRPDSGEKTFQAGILDIIDLPALYDSNKDCEHDLVLVSTPKFITWEGRFVVSKFKEIIASSTYRFQGKVCLIPSVPVEATKFCQEVLNSVEYHPDSVFCLDICRDSDGNCWILELTSFSSAGLYSTDKDRIVQKVSEIAEREYSLR
jgi:hypothetical protein